MNSTISKWGFLYPIHYLRNECIVNNLNDVDLIEKMDHKQLSQFQLNALRNIVDISAVGYDYVRDYISSNDFYLTDLELFKKIPFSDKKIIKSRIANEKFSPLQYDRRSTSGTTGTPFVFYKDHLATGYMEAVQRHAFGWYGVKFGAPQAILWGMRRGKYQYFDLLKDILKNRKRLSAFNLNQKEMFEFVGTLNKFRPEYFYGYTSAVGEFVDFIASNNDVSFLENLKLIVCTGEFVEEEVLTRIANVMGVPCANEYGCGEVGVIGFTCPAGNMHVMQSNIYLEVVDSHGNVLIDQEGDIVITELHAKKFPFLRYKTGDRGLIHSEMCSCGRKSLIFSLSAGRIVDFVITQTGKKISSRVFKYVLKNGILKFKVIQKTPKDIDVYIIKDIDFMEEYIHSYNKELDEVFGGEIETKFYFVDDIPRQASGKFRDFSREF